MFVSVQRLILSLCGNEGSVWKICVCGVQWVKLLNLRIHHMMCSKCFSELVKTPANPCKKVFSRTRVTGRSVESQCKWSVFHTVNQTDEWCLCPFVSKHSDRDSSAMNNTHRFFSICIPQRRLFLCVYGCMCVTLCVCFFGWGINEDEDRRHCLLCLCMRVGRCVWGVSALHESLKRNWGPRRHTETGELSSVCHLNKERLCLLKTLYAYASLLLGLLSGWRSQNNMLWCLHFLLHLMQGKLPQACV